MKCSDAKCCCWGSAGIALSASKPYNSAPKQPCFISLETSSEDRLLSFYLQQIIDRATEDGHPPCSVHESQAALWSTVRSIISSLTPLTHMLCCMEIMHQQNQPS